MVSLLSITKQHTLACNKQHRHCFRVASESLEELKDN